MKCRHHLISRLHSSQLNEKINLFPIEYFTALTLLPHTWPFPIFETRTLGTSPAGIRNRFSKDRVLYNSLIRREGRHQDGLLLWLTPFGVSLKQFRSTWMSPVNCCTIRNWREDGRWGFWNPLTPYHLIITSGCFLISEETPSHSSPPFLRKNLYYLSLKFRKRADWKVRKWEETCSFLEVFCKSHHAMYRLPTY